MLFWTRRKMRSDDWRKRQDAAIALGRSKDPRAVTALIGLFNDPHQEKGWFDKRPVRDAAVEALGRIGGRALEPLISALQQDDHRVWQPSARALGMIHDERAITALSEALVSKELGKRWALIEPLRQLGAVPSLILALANDDPGVRQHASMSLAQLGDSSAVPALLPLLADVDASVREEAAKALKTLGWEPKNDSQRALQAIALHRWSDAAALGAAAVDGLIRAIRGTDRVVGGPRLADGAREALAQLTDASAEARLLSALADANHDVREGAARALAARGDARALEPLLEILSAVPERPSERDNDRRARVVNSLHLVADHRTIAPLIAIVRTAPGFDSSDMIGVYAAFASASSAIDMLLRILERDGSEASIWDLREVAELFDSAYISNRSAPSCQHIGRRIDCAQLKQLARQELVRRGLSA